MCDFSLHGSPEPSWAHAFTYLTATAKVHEYQLGAAQSTSCAVTKATAARLTQRTVWFVADFIFGLGSSSVRRRSSFVATSFSDELYPSTTREGPELLSNEQGIAQVHSRVHLKAVTIGSGNNGPPTGFLFFIPLKPIHICFLTIKDISNKRAGDCTVKVVYALPCK